MLAIHEVKSSQSRQIILVPYKYGTSPSSQARNLMRNTVVVEDLIGSQPLGYRFLFCKMPPLRPISRQLNKSVKAIYPNSSKLHKAMGTDFNSSFLSPIRAFCLHRRGLSSLRYSYNISYHFLLVKKNKNKCSIFV